MNEKTFQFLDDEIKAASGDRQRERHLKAVKGYLLAAKNLREEFGRKRNGEYTSVPAFVDRFDLECLRAAP